MARKNFFIGDTVVVRTRGRDKDYLTGLWGKVVDIYTGQGLVVVAIGRDFDTAFKPEELRLY